MPPKHPIELLAPAGNLEKLEIAIHYGADAVYLGGKEFSLRNFSGNFTLEELRQAIRYAHARNVKVYLACNIYARNQDQPALAEYLGEASRIGPDALIVADAGVLMLARDIAPQIPIHLSTQANTTSYLSARFWEAFGVARINVARELSLTEIAEMAAKCSLEIEAFVHGAMCISYSGRCLLSNFMARRDGNRGQCAHACRWKYAVVEETRPGRFMPFAEDPRGAYLFNARDLCMIEHLPAMIDAGIDSLKIEGRMKGINYLAATVKVYREAIDACLASPETYRVQEQWERELSRVNNRGYCTGFYFGDPDQVTPDYTGSATFSAYRIAAKVLPGDIDRHPLVEVRNKICPGDVVEIISPGRLARENIIDAIIDESGRPAAAAQPGSRVALALSTSCFPNDLIRKIDAATPRNSERTHG